MFSDSEDMVIVGGKWEDEEERRFYEDVQDLKDYVPSSVLGIDGASETTEDNAKEKEQERIQQEKEEFRQLEEELQKLQNDQPIETQTPVEEPPPTHEDE